MRLGWQVVWTVVVAAGVVFGGCGGVNICAVDSECADDSCPAGEEPFCDIPEGEVFWELQLPYGGFGRQWRSGRMSPRFRLYSRRSTAAHARKRAGDLDPR